MDFAQPLPMTACGMTVLLIYVEYLTEWVLVYPTSSGTASEVIAFIKQHKNYLFRRCQIIVADNGPCFMASSLEDHLAENSTNWNSVMA